MAALTGVMTADFSDFLFEVDKSVVKLKELEGASTHTEGAIDGFSDGLSQADKTLGVFGIRIGPQIQALRELGGAAGKTASEIGLIGTAGLAVGAAVGGWQIGRMIADFTSLDETIGNAAASLLGYGDVAAQRAGAGMDVLNRATQIAGRTITDFNVALAIIKESNDKLGASLNTGTARLREWDAQISKLRASGDLALIERDLKNGSSTLKELAVQYGVSERALQHYMNRTKESTTILDKWRAAEEANLKKVQQAQVELNQAGGGWRDTLTSIAPATAAAATAYLALGASQGTIATALRLSTVEVAALDKALQLQTATIQRSEPELGTLDQFMRGLAPEIRKAGESTLFFDQQLIASVATVTAEAVPALEKLDETFRSVTEAAREMTTATTSKNAPGSVGVNLGGLTFGSVSPEAAMAAYTARFGTSSAAGMIGGGPAPDFLTWAMKMGYASQGTTVNNNFNIVDTESEIARRVADEVNRQIQRGSLVS